jgi:hypothetical protein
MPAAGGAQLNFLGKAESDPVQPTAQRLVPVASPGDLFGLLGQRQEGGLKSILGIGTVTKHATTDAQYHRPMPAQELGKCCPTVIGIVGRQQFMIADRGKATHLVG